MDHTTMAARSRKWTRNELLLAFRLYCRTPFGRLHQHNFDIIELARLIDRTPSAVAMKACNFASLDPVQQARDISALGNVSRADRALWDEFAVNPEALAADAEEVHDAIVTEQTTQPEQAPGTEIPAQGSTEVERTVRARRVQSFFRHAVLTSYEHRCAISRIAVPDLLNASHIIPWARSVERRADPRNGICLNTLYDRAFDRGLLTFDEDLRVVVSNRLNVADPPPLHRQALLKIHGQALNIPSRFQPDPDAIAFHRENVFM